VATAACVVNADDEILKVCVAVSIQAPQLEPIRAGRLDTADNTKCALEILIFFSKFCSKNIFAIHAWT
jgi:hypothetical protein